MGKEVTAHSLRLPSYKLSESAGRPRITSRANSRVVAEIPPPQ